MKQERQAAPMATVGKRGSRVSGHKQPKESDASARPKVKPSAPESITHGAGLQFKEKDFHAKPICKACGYIQENHQEGIDQGYLVDHVFDAVFPQVDVLLERAAYEKEIANNEHYWKATAANWQAQWRMQADFRKQDDLELKKERARAEAAEKQLADMKAAYEYCLTGEKEAEERVKELEKLLEGRIYEHNLCLKALAGEKIK